MGDRKDGVLPYYDMRAAARDRDHGMAKVRSVTWRAGAAGVALAGLLTLAFGHHSEAATSSSQHQQGSGGILIPAQPPKSGSGSGQVVSGAS
jgi:hypothetical protein